MKRIVFSLFLLLFVVLSPVWGQRDSVAQKSDVPVWVDLGMGGGGFSQSSPDHSSETAGMLFGASLNWQSKSLLAKIRFNYIEEFQLMSVRNPVANLFEFSGLVGKEIINHRFHFHYYTGLGIASSTSRGGFKYRGEGWFAPSYYEEISHVQLQIPIDVSISYYFKKNYGIGVGLVGGIAPSQVYWGLKLVVPTGAIR